MKQIKTVVAVIILAALAACLLTGCGSLLKSNSTLITIDGSYEISRDQLIYYAEALRSSNTGVDYTNEETAKSAMTYCANQAINSYILLKWAKEEYGLEITDADRASVAETLTTLETSYGSAEKLDAALAERNFTRELYTKLALEMKVQSALSNLIYAENSAYVTITPEQRADFIASKPVYGAKHILILANGDFDTALQKIMKIGARLEAGENFDTLMNENSEDTGLASNPNGYAYIAGTMVSEFEDAVKALKVGEVSAPVKTSYGYHLIMRVEVTDIFDISSIIIKSRISDKISEILERSEVKYANGYDKLKFGDLVYAYTDKKESN